MSDLCVCVGGVDVAPHCTCGGQRQPEEPASVPHIHVFGACTQVIGLGQQVLNLLSHLTSPKVVFLKGQEYFLSYLYYCIIICMCVGVCI